MAEWITEPTDYHEQVRVIALELDDGTRLRNYKTTLENKYGYREQFNIIGYRKCLTWYGWGPHDMEVKLSRNTIQSMFDAGDLVIVDE